MSRKKCAKYAANAFKNEMERLLLVSPELGEVLTAIIHRVRRGPHPC